MDIELIISRIKTAFFLKNDAELSSFLGISPQNLSNWKKRNSIDWDLVFTKCEILNYNWLVNGNGPVLKSEFFIKEQTSDQLLQCNLCKIKDQLISSQHQTITLLQDKIKKQRPNKKFYTNNDKIMD